MSYTIKVKLRGRLFWRKFTAAAHFEEQPECAPARLVLDLENGSQRLIPQHAINGLIFGADYFDQKARLDAKRAAEAGAMNELRAKVEVEVRDQVAAEQQQQLLAMMKNQQQQAPLNAVPNVPGPRSFAPPQARVQ